MKTIILLLISFAIVFTSCIDPIYYDGDDVDCYYCYPENQFPDSADLIIDLTINSTYPKVEIKVYAGMVDNAPVIANFEADTSTVYVYVPIDHLYSVEAIYSHNNKTIRVIESDKLEAKLVTEICDEDCWYIVGGEYELNLNE
ncbi:MAG TPA: hypothetical protein PLO05_10405 [Bacteroidales bacterium]|jgi:hypothetical protein|nr:hypothetical protein [Bacteroidales bacterium]MDD4236755.1 hypothetical protein [Bacteroidales bacterium]MDY0161059.1 hypothetical protein [Bacteroidales bacterium]HXK82557.1 hypothetical protein [Bacteroidales bacterium]